MATPRKGISYPEFDHYDRPWRMFERRLRAEGGHGRYEKMKKWRLAYKKEKKCTNDESWHAAVLEFPPLGAEEIRLYELGLPGGKSEKDVVADYRKKGSKYKNPAGWVSYRRFVTFDALKNVDPRALNDYCNWAEINAFVRGIKADSPDVPHPLAFALLRMRQSDPERFKEFRAANSKSKSAVGGAQEAEWMKDDQELLGILERAVQGAAAPAAAG